MQDHRVTFQEAAATARFAPAVTRNRPGMLRPISSRHAQMPVITVINNESKRLLAAITREQWESSLKSKLLGQINLVQQALPYINEKGSFTLISGILGDEQIFAGTRQVHGPA